MSSSSSTEAPKLFTHKPKKSQQKPVQGKTSKDFYGPSSTASSSSSASIGTRSYPSSSAAPPPKESFARRYKFLWPLLLTVNLAVGAYIFTRTKKKETVPEEEPAETSPSTQESTMSTITSVVAANPMPSIMSKVEPVKIREQVPEDQQLELFKWMLDEKRKAKPKDREEMKRIDEEKDLLKQFIRAKSVPSL